MSKIKPPNPADSFTIKLPVALSVATPGPRFVGVRLSRVQSVGMAGLRVALREGHRKLASGEPVYSNSAAVQWLIEQVASEIEQAKLPPKKKRRKK